MLSSGFLLALAGSFLVGAGYSMCESAGTAVLSPIICQFANDKLDLGWRTFFIGTHAKFALGTEAHNAMILSVFWITQIPSRI